MEGDKKNGAEEVGYQLGISKSKQSQKERENHRKSEVAIRY